MTEAPRLAPHANCYWVPGVAILAGEYPGSYSRTDALFRLQLLVDAGVRTFLDLTEDGELRPYEPLLSDIAAVTLTKAKRPRSEAATESPGTDDLRYVRVPVPDFGVPDAPTMHRILDLLDAELAAGRTVYLHCWGGVGRTGTVVGCHLVRRGRTGDEALATIAELWRSVEKRGRHPTSPETGRQRELVRRWHDAERGRNESRGTEP